MLAAPMLVNLPFVWCTVYMALFLPLFLHIECLLLARLCIAGGGGASSERPYLIALLDAGAPEQTMEQWHLLMEEGIPEAAKFYAHKTLAAEWVRMYCMH
jgi:hypothetical protein